jgi:hypothetical protein
MAQCCRVCIGMLHVVHYLQYKGAYPLRLKDHIHTLLKECTVCSTMHPDKWSGVVVNVHSANENVATKGPGNKNVN